MATPAAAGVAHPEHAAHPAEYEERQHRDEDYGSDAHDLPLLCGTGNPSTLET
jgi:hypothetical protein